MTGLDRDGFDDLYRRHSRELLGFLIRRGAGPDAEDLLAETFLTTWRRLDRLSDADLHRAWLYGVARRLLARWREIRPANLDALFDPSTASNVGYLVAPDAT